MAERLLGIGAMLTTCRTSVRAAALALGAALLLVSTPGCGKRIPKTYPVKGKVIHKGGRPVTYGRVELQSKSDPQLRAVGDIQTDGTFSLTTHLGGKSVAGAVEGE